MTPKTPRRFDRRDLLALVGALLVAAARARPELLLPLPLPVDSLRDRRLRAHGAYDYAGERLWHGRSYEGIPGVDFITPLRLSDGMAVLVDRGWAPSPDGYHVDQPAYREGDSAVVEGLGMAAPRGRGDVDPAALRDSLPYPLLSVVIQQLPPSTTLHRPPPSHLTRWPLPALSDGPHLSYVVQWFSFAVIIVVGSLVLLRQRSIWERPEGYQ